MKRLFLFIYFELLLQKNEEEEVDTSDKSSGSSHSDERRGSFAFPM